jgi:membrane protein required for colicin V production
MIAVDYIILAIILISAVMGLVRGLLREAVAVITWFLAIVLAWSFASSLEPVLGGILVGSPLRIWAARAIIFVGVLLLGGAVAVILGHYVRVSMFAGMDKFLGFVFGIVRGIVIVGAFTIAIQALRMDEDERWKHSRLLPYATAVADALRGIVGEKLERIEMKLSDSTKTTT